MVRVLLELVGRHAHELVLDGAHVGAGRETDAIGDAEDVRVDRDRRFAERRVQNDVGRLATDARQRLERIAVARHLAAVLATSSAAQVFMRFLALLLKRPIVLM